MKLTAMDIIEKEFAGSMFGYNKKEVKDYLELLAKQIENINKKINETELALRAKPSPDDELERRLADREQLITKTLLMAEQVRAEKIQLVEQEAENITKEAQIKAEKVVDDASIRGKQIVEEAHIHSKKTIADARNYLNLLEHDFYKIQEEKRQFLIKSGVEIEMLLTQIKSDPLYKQKTPVKMPAQKPAAGLKDEK